MIVESHKELRCPECRILVEVKVEELPPNVLLMRILEGMKNSAPRKLVTGQRTSRSGHIQVSCTCSYIIVVWAYRCRLMRFCLPQSAQIISVLGSMHIWAARHFICSFCIHILHLEQPQQSICLFPPLNTFLEAYLWISGVSTNFGSYK